MKVKNSFEARQVSPLMLAYLGDAVVELKVREKMLDSGCYDMKKVHRKTVSYVRASSQARAMYMLKDSLSGEEKSIYRRGRNARTGHVRKSSCPQEYKMATAFEALVGYLHLIKDYRRLEQVFETLIQAVEKGAEE